MGIHWAAWHASSISSYRADALQTVGCIGSFPMGWLGHHPRCSSRLSTQTDLILQGRSGEEARQCQSQALVMVNTDATELVA